MVIRRHSSAPFHLPICFKGYLTVPDEGKACACVLSYPLCRSTARFLRSPTAALFGLLHHEPWAGGHPLGGVEVASPFPVMLGVISATLASRARLSSSICARFLSYTPQPMPAQGLGVARRHGICPRASSSVERGMPLL